MVGEIRLLNATSVLDLAWNVANCSLQTDYLVVNGSDGTICICHQAWGDSRCSTHSPSAPLVRLIGSQIILGIALGLLFVVGLAILVGAIFDSRGPDKRKHALRIVATVALLIAIVFKIIWLIDTAESNFHLRLIDRAVGGFLWWVSVGLIIFAYIFVIANWLEMLTAKLALLTQARYSTKLAIGLSVPFIALNIAFEAIRLSGVVDMFIVSVSFTGLFSIGLSIAAVVLALTIRRRMADSQKLKAHTHGAGDSLHAYALRVTTVFLLFPVPVVVYLVTIAISFGAFYFWLRLSRPLTAHPFPFIT